MAEHTKEPWEVQPSHEDSALFIIGSNLGGLVGAAHGWPSEIESGNHSRIEANARRIVACVNALAGIPDPAAFVQAARGMREAAEAARNRIWGLEATAIADGKTELAQKLEGWANELSTALAAFNAAMGEGQSDE